METNLAPLLAPDMTVGDLAPADRNPARVYLASLPSPDSRRTMKTALLNVGRMLCGRVATLDEVPWHRLEYQHTQALRAALIGQYAPATCNLHLAALRGALREAWRLGIMDGECYRRASDLAGIKAEVLPAGRALDAGELRALFAGCGTTHQGRRNAAVLCVLYGAGLRRAEAVALDLDDYTPETGELKVRTGKGRRQRTAFLPPSARAALERWLAIRGVESGPLLVPVQKGGRVELRRMSPQAVFGIARRMARAAAVQRWSPHDARRSFVSDLLAAGADLATAQALAGHASPTTTVRYDRRPLESRRRAASLLHVPCEV